jgi:hypothetical protein
MTKEEKSEYVVNMMVKGKKVANEWCLEISELDLPVEKSLQIIGEIQLRMGELVGTVHRLINEE